MANRLSAFMVYQQNTEIFIEKQCPKGLPGIGSVERISE
jgi:hypothetical protein